MSLLDLTGRAAARGAGEAKRSSRQRALSCESLEGRSLLSMVWSGPWIAGQFHGTLPRNIDLSPHRVWPGMRLGRPAPADAQGISGGTSSGSKGGAPSGPTVLPGSKGILLGGQNTSPGGPKTVPVNQPGSSTGPNGAGGSQNSAGGGQVSSTVMFDVQTLNNDLNKLNSELPASLSDKIKADQATINQALANTPPPGGSAPQGPQGLSQILQHANVPSAQIDSILADLQNLKRELATVDPALTAKIAADNAKLSHDSGQTPPPRVVFPKDPGSSAGAYTPLSKDMSGKTITTTTTTTNNNPPPPDNTGTSPRAMMGTNPTGGTGADSGGSTGTTTPTGRGSTGST